MVSSGTTHGQTNRATPERVLLVFVDGFGLPREPLGDSVYAPYPTICRLLGQHAVPLDATLGVAGTPQSATGQATILTGINAAELLGMHLGGFPNAALRHLITQENIFTKLHAAGVSCTFANAYVHFPGASMPLHLRSATTVATLAAFAGTRNKAELLRGEAVFHDLTRHTLAAHEAHADVPAISEETAAEQLLAIFREVRFCLFEYFLTDIAGHRGSPADKQRVLASLERFLAALLGGLRSDAELLLLVSDHGNIECGEHHDHSLNPVPLVAVGPGAAVVQERCRNLTGVTPAVMTLIG